MGITSIKQEVNEEEGKEKTRIMVTLVIPETQKKTVFEGLALVQLASELTQTPVHRHNFEIPPFFRAPNIIIRELDESPAYEKYVPPHIGQNTTKKNSRRCNDRVKLSASKNNHSFHMNRSNHQSRQLNGATVRSHKISSRQNKK